MRCFCLLLVAASAAVTSSRPRFTESDLHAMYGAGQAAAAESLASYFPLLPVEPVVGAARASAPQTLRQAAEAAGIWVGAALNAGHLASDPEYVSVGNAQYSLATAENSCKFEFTEPSNGTFSFTDCDSVYNDIVGGAVVCVCMCVCVCENPP